VFSSYISTFLIALAKVLASVCEHTILTFTQILCNSRFAQSAATTFNFQRIKSSLSFLTSVFSESIKVKVSSQASIDVSCKVMSDVTTASSASIICAQYQYFCQAAIISRGLSNLK